MLTVYDAFAQISVKSPTYVTVTSPVYLKLLLRISNINYSISVTVHRTLFMDILLNWNTVYHCHVYEMRLVIFIIFVANVRLNVRMSKIWVTLLQCVFLCAQPILQTARRFAVGLHRIWFFKSGRGWIWDCRSGRGWSRMFLSWRPTLHHIT